ncbi:MAG: DUF1127 domain-containing protein [Leucothrix sp.]
MKTETGSTIAIQVPCRKKWSLKRLLDYTSARYKMRYEVLAERKQLANLPETLLNDIGIRREDALQESRLPASALPQDRISALKKQYCQE